MSDSTRPALELTIDGRLVVVPAGTSVAVAIALQRGFRSRSALQGSPRGPVCGMGICFECCATVDGRRLVRTCLLLCRPNMKVETHA